MRGRSFPWMTQGRTAQCMFPACVTTQTLESGSYNSCVRTKPAWMAARTQAGTICRMVHEPCFWEMEIVTCLLQIRNSAVRAIFKSCPDWGKTRARTGRHECYLQDKVCVLCGRPWASPCAMWRMRVQPLRRSIKATNLRSRRADCRTWRPRAWCPAYSGCTPCQ